MQRSDASNVVISSVVPSQEAQILNTLIEGVQYLRSNYIGDNPHRFELITLWEKLRDYLTAQSAISDKEKAKMLYAAYLFAWERIEAERWTGQGSSLQDLICFVLKSKDLKEISQADRLILLNKLNEFANSTDAAGIQIAGKPLKTRLTELQITVYYRLLPDVRKLQHALPLENILDAGMLDIVHYYIEQKELQKQSLNKVRLVAAQLIQIVAKLNPYQAGQYEGMFSPSYRIKMGILLWAMQSINSSGSVLYRRIRAFNIKDIDPRLRKVCLLASRNFLRVTTAAQLESLGRQEFGDTNLLKNLEVFLDCLERELTACNAPTKQIFELSYLTTALGALGAVIFAVPMYGSGQALGHTVAETDFAVRPTGAISNLLHRPMQYVLGDIGGVLGNYAANMVVSNTLEYAFGLALETLGIIIGGAAGAVIGLAVFQLTPALLKTACSLVFNMNAQVTDPVLAEKVRKNIELLKALYDLPETVFTLDDRKQLASVLGSRDTLFPRQASVPALQPVSLTSTSVAATVADAARQPLLSQSP